MLRIHKARLLILSCLILASPAYSAAADELPWSPAQATGEMNSPKAGDQKTAWASLAQDKGAEWIKLEYKTPVEVQAVRIYENFNPGAVSKVTGFDKDGTEVLIWEGKEPFKKAPNIFEVKPESKLVSQSIKV